MYNFTVDENEDLDIEISVDPEMLGRVFENLLEENIRKEGGSFYTPKTIVKFMCESSLINYIKQKLNNLISLDEIENFLINQKLSNNLKKKATLFDEVLKDIKI